VKTLILGLGNDIMSDDAAGILVARAIKARIDDGVADVVESTYAGWRLIDLLRGYERVIVVDAIVSSQCAPGAVCRVDLADIRSLHLQSSHGMGLHEACSFARLNGFQMPQVLSAYAVGVTNPYVFGTELSQEVADCIDAIADEIIREESLVIHTCAVVG